MSEPARPSGPAAHVEPAGARTVGSQLGRTGRVRFAVTDRHGIRATPSVRTVGDPDAVMLGWSAGPYAAFDLALHVGDDAQAVGRNRRALTAATGADAIAFMDQVHGADVATITNAGDVPTADAMVTATPGLALAVLVADCVPVVLADEEAGVVGVVHAGRKGVQAGVVAAAVRAMADLGADPARTAAVIGPAVCPLCYEVPAAMRDEVAAVVPVAAAESRTGTPALHLRRAVAAQLDELGAVDAVGACTAEDESLYSYRRDGTTGRFAMLVWLTR